MTGPPDTGSRRPPRLRSDAQLVAGARAGCPASGDEIARRYRPALRAQCARIAGPDAAEDAVQEALVKALRALAAGQSPGELRPWLYRIARNAAIDELRRRPADWEPLDPQIDGVPQPPQIAATRADLRELLAGAAALPERQRQALRMRVVDERSYDEIATALGAGEGTVRALLHRARSRLREGAAVVLLPFWRVARHGPLAHAGSGAATAAKAGLAIGVLASAGAAGVVLHASAPARTVPHERAAVSAAPPPAPVAVARTVASRRARPAAAHKRTVKHRRAEATTSRAGARTVRRPARTQPAPPSSSAAPASAARRPDPPAAPAPAPATAPSTSPPPPPAPDPAPAPAQPQPAPSQAPEPPATPPAPSATPAPAARGQITAWTPDAPGGNEGLLEVQSGANPPVARRLTATTDLRCYRVADGRALSFDACPAGALAAGTAVAGAETQPADGGASWRLVYLIIPA